jgi:hypothetical protein
MRVIKSPTTRSPTFMPSNAHASVTGAPPRPNVMMTEKTPMNVARKIVAASGARARADR